MQEHDSSQKWRHVILVAGAVLGLALTIMGSSVLAYYDQIEQSGILGEGYPLLDEMRDAVGRAPDAASRRDALDRFVLRHRQDGVRYAAMHMNDRGLTDGDVVQTGDRIVAPELERFVRTGDLELIRGVNVLDGERVFLLAPHVLTDDARRSLPSGSEQSISEKLSKAPPLQLIEFVPVKTLELKRRAHLTMLACVVGALIALLGSLYLWKLVGQRARASRKLREQQLLASLGKMSALMAHELRNPLAAAIGQANLLQLQSAADQDLHRLSQAVLDELERLDALSRHLLNFVNSRKINLSEHLLDPFILDIEQLSRTDQLVVRREQAPTSWLFDRITLVRAVDNVVSNALELTPDGEAVTLTITEHEGDLRLVIDDRGPGLPEGVDIFEPFVSTTQEGTGLGLAITSEIVLAHGGTIDAIDRPDGGARVTITLPGAPAPSA